MERFGETNESNDDTSAVKEAPEPATEPEEVPEKVTDGSDDLTDDDDDGDDYLADEDDLPSDDEDDLPSDDEDDLPSDDEDDLPSDDEDDLPSDDEDDLPSDDEDDLPSDDEDDLPSDDEDDLPSDDEDDLPSDDDSNDSNDLDISKQEKGRKLENEVRDFIKSQPHLELIYEGPETRGFDGAYLDKVTGTVHIFDAKNFGRADKTGYVSDISSFDHLDINVEKMKEALKNDDLDEAVKAQALQALDYSGDVEFEVIGGDFTRMTERKQNENVVSFNRLADLKQRA